MYENFWKNFQLCEKNDSFLTFGYGSGVSG